MPMLAKLLAKHHGFHCTVLFSLNEDNEVDPTQKIRWENKMVTHNISGLEHLEKCDLVILFSRLFSLPPEQLHHIYRYLDSGKPLIGIRTANHGFIDGFHAARPSLRMARIAVSRGRAGNVWRRTEKSKPHYPTHRSPSPVQNS